MEVGRKTIIVHVRSEITQFNQSTNGPVFHLSPPILSIQEQLTQRQIVEI